jgi:hypothetical protein
MSYWPRHISEEHPPLVFVHIPKTAGTSIRDWYKHTYGKFEKSMHASRSHPVLERAAQHCASFSVVRNPYDLVYSWYRYKREMLGETRHRDPKELAAWEKGFSYWLPRYVDKVNYSPDKTGYRDFNPISPGYTQLSYLRNSTGAVDCTFTLRFERLQQDFAIVKDYARSTYDLPVKNVTQIESRDYRTAYDVATRRIVERIYSEDLEFFNYDF